MINQQPTTVSGELGAAQHEVVKGHCEIREIERQLIFRLNEVADPELVKCHGVACFPWIRG